MENQIGCAGHRSRQIRQPAAQSKLRELRQRARSACFVPMMRKIKNNRDFQLSQRSLDSMRSLEMTKKAVWMTKKLARDDRNYWSVGMIVSPIVISALSLICHFECLPNLSFRPNEVSGEISKADMYKDLSTSSGRSR